MSTIYARLQRLVSSEICKAGNVEKYAAELRLLAGSVGDDALFRSKEKFFKTLGDSSRLRIVKMLAVKEMCVCEIMVALDVTQPNASHHLNILEREGIVKKRREGKWALYSLNMPEILALINGFFIRKKETHNLFRTANYYGECCIPLKLHIIGSTCNYI
ncbi:MAG: winged helix-turn-helix transcriptional regulator [archaeon]|nr:winged helix-turn-helix transcriptional regulator [archaeon]MCP8313052.1 winged helix-turn-helix transcriptional regulator [archaeon]